jgi:L-seryl-tRNA(Ser) seleniumtransferase
MKLGTDPRRGLPAVDRLAAAVRAAAVDLPAWAAVAGARSALDEARCAAATQTGAPPKLDALAATALLRARALAVRHPRRVVNATGVVLHTNLGRAVMARGAGEAALEAATRYGDLELDLATGRRGDRLAPLGRKLALLAGCEAALAVNNNAAAVLLAVATLARGREVVVSRGELLEIGGSFRLPDILETAGVRLVEVGTTNRTHPEDYRRALRPETALLLKVHRSNFEQHGYVAEVGIGALAVIARERGVPLLEDLGSATLIDLRGQGLPEETVAPARLRLGADVVCFSGDKLLGGPQAGILLGSARHIDAMRRNPLARALRLDKMTIAALDWTVEALLAGDASETLPALRQLSESTASVEQRARSLAALLAEGVAAAGWQLEVTESRAPVGGGSLPGFELPSWAVAIRATTLTGGAEAFAARLRSAAVPVVARVAADVVLLDVRTLLDGDAAAIEAAVMNALQGESR